MFDIGFSELLLIALVTLLVMGPERLPQAVRSISLWLGRLKQMFATARRDLEQEVGMDDIRQQLHNEQVMRELNESKEQLEESYNQAFDNSLEMTSENPFEAPAEDKKPLASADKEPSASPNKEPSASRNKEQDPDD
ncbi:MAG: Sec-independent protein translocase protein TatB [Porticoccaceae bacterium]